MIYHGKQGQVSSGEAIGILLLDTPGPFIPGDVANASSYSFPVCFRKVAGFSVARAVGQDPTVYDELLSAACDLVSHGVRAVTGDCGFMALHQKQLARDLRVPVFLSSLLQLPFMLSILSEDSKIGVITVDSRSLNNELLAAVGVHDTHRIIIEGLEEKKNFHHFAIEESGILDTGKVEKEVIEAGQNLLIRAPEVKAILLECSLLPPYSKALQNAVNLPVFDYITMINFVFSAAVQKSYQGFV